MKSPRIFALLLFLITTPAMAGNDSPKALQDAFLAALKAGDAAGLAACYAEDAVNFPVDSLMDTGPAAVKASWDGFFAKYTVLDVTLSDNRLETHGDTAIAWGVFHMSVRPTDGSEPVDMTGRYMDVARNFEGNWLYVADHASMPLPGESGSP